MARPKGREEDIRVGKTFSMKPAIAEKLLQLSNRGRISQSRLLEVVLENGGLDRLETLVSRLERGNRIIEAELEEYPQLKTA